jgi:hypothetical protein
MRASPYRGIPRARWLTITQELVASHPLSSEELVNVCLDAWTDIFQSKIGKKPFFIGEQIFPKPQIMGFLLHELIPLKIANKYPTVWRREKDARDKDLVYIPDESKSIEIKTSSSAARIFGNRSYAQESRKTKKKKSGYYLAINFEKFVGSGEKPKISLIRFGWLDHEDWIGQRAATGQQSRLDTEVEQKKLLVLYQCAE